MSDVAELIRDWRLWLTVVGVLGFLPGLLMRVLVLVYPAGHPRRDELVAELYAQPYIERPLFLAQQLETALLSDGLPARWRGWRTAGYPVPAVRRIAAWRRRSMPTVEETLRDRLDEGEALVHLDGTSYRSFVLKNPLLMAVTGVGALVVSVPLSSRDLSALDRIAVLAFVVTFAFGLARRMLHQSIHYAVTDLRVIRISGLVRREMVSVPWGELHGVDYRRTRMGLLLGYAEFIIETRTGEVWLFSEMNDPVTFIRRVLEVVAHEVLHVGQYSRSLTRGEWKNLLKRLRQRNEELALCWPATLADPARPV